MSERSEYPAGVPCWVQTLQPDPDAARGFYKALLGWGFGADGSVAQLRGRDVAGIDMLPAGGAPAWITYIRVKNADDAAQRAGEAGGTVLIGTLDAAPAGRFAVLADPSGVPFCVWEAGERVGAQLVNEPGTWTMSSLHTPDPDGARRFYGDLFGWVTEPIAPGVEAARLGGYAGEKKQPLPTDTVALIAPAAEGVPPHWNVNLRVADADATGERATSLGATVLGPPVDAFGLRSLVIADPQGAVFSISAPKVG
jgi:predicted enzyme related to lactoylglutathione lyase